MNFNKQWFFVFLIALVLCEANVRVAATIHVPDDYATIQAGIDAASNGDVVLVADGTYTDTNLTWDGNVKHITVKSENGPDNCIIDCGLAGRAFFFNETNQNADDVIDGFTITNGFAEDGGGIYCYYSSPTITNCIIKANSVSGDGGGIYFEDSSPFITNCTIGGEYEEDGNYAEYLGGGIYCVGISSPLITDCRIANNFANNDAGGGIFCDFSSCPTITNCIIKGNSVSGDGAGIYCDNSSPIITNCTIAYNFTDLEDGGFGGGIYSCDSYLTITNCQITNNQAEDGGGGIYITDSVEPLHSSITNCTIASNNTAFSRDGIYINNSSPIVKNSILWGNGSSYQIDLYNSSELTIDYSDVEGGEGGIYIEGGSVLEFGEHNIDSDPLFIQPALDDFHLTMESPCKDAGTSDGAPTDDIDGQPRPFGIAVDIGSDEYSSSYTVETGSGDINISVSDGALIWNELVDEDDLPDTGKPELTFPFGFLYIEIADIEEGATVTVTLTYPDDIPTDAQYWKYNEITEEWYQFEFGSNDGDNIITLTLTDGGDGDMDDSENGYILDPGGIGLAEGDGGGDGSGDGSGGGSGGGGHCFIATACYGTPMAEEVEILSRFRDECLLTNPMGKRFVIIYYKLSPPIADFIKSHSILKNIIRNTLYPLIWMSEKSIE